MPAMTFVITGVTSGLGQALTTRLLAEGHRVYGCARRPNPVPGAISERFAFRQLDILDRAAVVAWAREVTADSAVDVLVHNAAVMHPSAPLWEIDAKQLDAVLDINIKGSFHVLGAFAPAMVEAGRGLIITLSSGAGRRGIAGISGYCASKWAIEGLTKALAEDLPAPLAAVPLAPGVIDTPMLRINFGEAAAQYQKPEAWAVRASAFIQGLNRTHNGQSLIVPEA